MVSFRRHLHGLIQLALAAVLVTALWPTLARARLAYATGEPAWTAICTAGGLQVVAVDHGTSTRTNPTAGIDGTRRHGLLLDACDVCLLVAAAALGLAPGIVFHAPPDTGVASVPARRSVDFGAATWDAARPRGPPALA